MSSGVEGRRRILDLKNGCDCSVHYRVLTFKNYLGKSEQAQTLKKNDCEFKEKHSCIDDFSLPDPLKSSKTVCVV